jgi:hypothetical protein
MMISEVKVSKGFEGEEICLDPILQVKTFITKSVGKIRSSLNGLNLNEGGVTIWLSARRERGYNG